MYEEEISGILSLAAQWSIGVSISTADSVVLFMRQLLLWNARVNLTGARSVGDLLGEHLPDSFALAKLVKQDAVVVDVGSGGGLPAIPFALLRPDCQVTLVEPRAKRVAFLNTITRQCGCRSVTIMRKRAEEMGGFRFSAAFSRATFPPQDWLKLAPSLLVPNGVVVVLTTAQVQPDVTELRLLDSVGYRCSSGTLRWAGCYCST